MCRVCKGIKNRGLCPDSIPCYLFVTKIVMSEKKIRRIKERNPWKYSDLGRVSERCDEIEKASRHFGKDEVSSSNLDSSSMKSLEPQRVEGFLFFMSSGLILKFVTDLLP